MSKKLHPIDQYLEEISIILDHVGHEIDIIESNSFDSVLVEMCYSAAVNLTARVHVLFDEEDIENAQVDADILRFEELEAELEFKWFWYLLWDVEDWWDRTLLRINYELGKLFPR